MRRRLPSRHSAEYAFCAIKTNDQRGPARFPSGPLSADDNYGPENNLQLEAGYIYADCISLQLLL
jgi:hypothetical protein